MQDKIRRKGLSWAVDSAGTGAWHIGDQPDPRSIRTAQYHGIDISSQRARQIQAADFDRFDLILTMDTSNFEDVNALAVQHGKRSDHIHLIMNFLHPESNHSVPDPYWDDNGFQQVYEMLDLACEQIVRRFAPEN